MEEENRKDKFYIFYNVQLDRRKEIQYNVLKIKPI